MSSALGNWFVWTPTSITIPAPASAMSRAIRSGWMRVFVSSRGWISMRVSLPNAFFSAHSRASPYSTARELDGMADRAHWMT